MSFRTQRVVCPNGLTFYTDSTTLEALTDSAYDPTALSEPLAGDLSFAEWMLRKYPPAELTYEI